MNINKVIEKSESNEFFWGGNPFIHQFSSWLIIDFGKQLQNFRMVASK